MTPLSRPTTSPPAADLPIGVALFDQALRLVWMTPAFVRLARLPAVAPDGVPLADLCQVQPALQTLLDHTRERVDPLLSYMLPFDGGEADRIRADLFPLKAGGYIAHWHAVLTSTAGGSLDEPDWRAYSDRHRLLFDKNPQPSWIFDRETLAFLEVNEAAIRQYGYTREEFFSLRLPDIRPALENARLEQDLQRASESVGQTGCWQHRRKDGSLLWAEVTGFDFVSFTRPARLVVVHDVTEQIRAAQELQRSNEELQQFAYAVSHDLQEPLRAIYNYTQLVVRRYRGRFDQEADEFLAYIEEGAGRLSHMVRDLLVYSRVASADLRVRLPVAADEALDAALENLQLAIEDSGAVVTRDPLPTVRAKPAQLMQLFQNLLSNAIKYRSAAAPQIHIAARQEGGQWIFRVRDNGIGIDPRHHDRIFGVFKRLHRAEYPGTGVGLAVCQRIVKNHGGRIWVESALGAGATFCFTVPV